MEKWSKNRIKTIPLILLLLLAHAISVASAPPPVSTAPIKPKTLPPPKKKAPPPTIKKTQYPSSTVEYKIIIEKNSIKNGIVTYSKVIGSETESNTFPESNFTGIIFDKNIRYVLNVREVEKGYETYLEVIEQIEPKKETEYPEENLIPAGIAPPTCFYDCNNSEKAIATYNEIIYTNYMLGSDGSIKIRPVNQDIDFYKFFGNIYGFTFHEDHKYTLEVKKNGNNYTLVKILCDTKLNIIPNPEKKEYPINANEPTIKTVNFDIPYTVKIEDIYSARWYLRYLFVNDGIAPINILKDTSHEISFDQTQQTLKIKTPCMDTYYQIRIDQNGGFKFYSTNPPTSNCDETSRILLQKMSEVNSYSITDNKLKLSYNNKDLIWFEGVIK